METFVTISVVVIGIVLLAVSFSWVYRHRCAICGNIHMNERELKECQSCGKLFCEDKSTHRETVRSNVKGVIGTGINAQKVNERKYYGKPCGYIYIQTNSQGSVQRRYCRNHNPQRIIWK